MSTCFRVARWLVVGVLLGAWTAPGAAAALECAPAPSSRIGYWVSAVHADATAAPVDAGAIAVLDSGVASVPELAGRLRPGFDAVAGRTTQDSDGHGTAVAAIAAAASERMLGIAPTSAIIPIKVLDRRGDTTPAILSRGIRAAVRLHARVINISVAGSGRASVAGLQDAIDQAVTAGIPVVAASGNDGSSRLGVPARLRHVIAVGATDESSLVAQFSNRGPGLDLVAPGSDMTTAVPSSVCATGFAFVSGTSFSAPVVSAAVALVRGLHEKLNVSQVAEMLRFHRAVPNPLWSPAAGFGALDVQSLLSAPVPPADSAEVNDSIPWARQHPPVLTAPRHETVVGGHLEPWDDPVDVLRLRLARGDRFQASANRQAPVAIALRSDRGALLASGRRIDARIKNRGQYFIAVTAKSRKPGGFDYSLTLKR